MPYCLIGKIVVWGVLPLAAILVLVAAYHVTANRLRVILWPGTSATAHSFLIERLWPPVSVFLTKDTAYWKQIVAEIIAVLLALITSPLLLLGYIELAVRYALKRFRKTTAPAALA